MVNLVEEGVDAAVRIGHLPDSTLVARHVGEMRRIVVASKAYLKARGAPKTPRDLVSHDTVQFGASTAPAEWRFAEAGREIRVATMPRFSTNSADAAIQYAEQGGGLTRVLAYQAAAAIRRGALTVVLEEFEQPPLPIHIVYPTSRLLSAKVRAFIDLVTETADWHFGSRRGE
jgi:DNA-binding transcriptional LysR family regulator